MRNLENEVITPIGYVENYFYEQRFGRNNVNVGRHLVKKEFAEAVKLIDEPACNAHLAEKQNDSVGALKKLPMRLLRLFVNAYQSWLWNETLAQFLKEKGKEVREETYSAGTMVLVENVGDFKEVRVPIPGFGDISSDSHLITAITTSTLRREHLEPSDFVIKQIPELSLEGEMRKAVVEVKNLVLGKMEEDELNAGKKKVKVSFALGKGSYATMVVRRLLS